MYKIIPGIEKKITSKLEELKLVPEGLTFKEHIGDLKRFYRNVCLDEKGNRVFFKSILQNNKKIITDYLREIKFNTFITEIYDRIKLNTPKVLDYSMDKKFLWVVQEFVPGLMLDDYVNDTGILNKYTKQVAYAIKSVSMLPFSLIRKLGVGKKLNYNYYSKEIEGYFKHKDVFKHFFSEHEVERIRNFLKDRKDVLDKTSPVIIHGDMSSANLMMHEKDVYVIDWEHVRSENRAYDMAEFYLKMHRHPKWRNDLMKYYMEDIIDSEEFIKLFKINLLRFIARDFLIFHYIYTKKKVIMRGSRLDQEINGYKNTMDMILEDKLNL